MRTFFLSSFPSELVAHTGHSVLVRSSVLFSLTHPQYLLRHKETLFSTFCTNSTKYGAARFILSREYSKYNPPTSNFSPLTVRCCPGANSEIASFVSREYRAKCRTFFFCLDSAANIVVSSGNEKEGICPLLSKNSSKLLVSLSMFKPPCILPIERQTLASNSGTFGFLNHFLRNASR